MRPSLSYVAVGLWPLTLCIFSVQCRCAMNSPSLVTSYTKPQKKLLWPWSLVFPLEAEIQARLPPSRQSSGKWHKRERLCSKEDISTALQSPHCHFTLHDSLETPTASSLSPLTHNPFSYTQHNKLKLCILIDRINNLKLCMLIDRGRQVRQGGAGGGSYDPEVATNRKQRAAIYITNTSDHKQSRTLQSHKQLPTSGVNRYPVGQGLVFEA